MADQTIRVEETVAQTASKMAFDLWVGKHGSAPTMDDRKEYLRLVEECAFALTGRSTTRPK